MHNKSYDHYTLLIEAFLRLIEGNVDPWCDGAVSSKAIKALMERGATLTESDVKYLSDICSKKMEFVEQIKRKFEKLLAQAQNSRNNEESSEQIVEE